MHCGWAGSETPFVLLQAHCVKCHKCSVDVEPGFTQEVSLSFKDFLNSSKRKGSKGTEGPEHHNTGIQHHLHIRIYREDSVDGDDFDARSPFSDVARLGRWLMGTQTGLTLGGGGARYTYNTAVSCCGCAAPLLLQSTFHTLTHILPLSTPLTHHSLIHHSFHPSEDWPTSVCTKLWWKVGCRWT